MIKTGENMYKRILLPTDGSKGSENAAKHALVIAQAFDSVIYVLNVMETRPTSGVTVDILKKEGELALEKISRLFKDMEKESGYNKKIKKCFLIQEGSASDEIIKTAEKENMELIVIGGSGKHRVERFILGSVAEKVVRDATSPVLTVH